MINNLLKLLDSYLLNTIENSDVETYDLTTKEGQEKMKQSIKELRDSPLFNFLDIDINKLLDNFEKISYSIYEQSNNTQKEQKQEPQPKLLEKTVEDHTEEIDNTQKFVRPSESLSVNQKLQLHKIVQEYVDTMIKPYSKNVLTNDQINDAYAGLYEFGAWVVNR